MALCAGTLLRSTLLHLIKHFPFANEKSLNELLLKHIEIQSKNLQLHLLMESPAQHIS